MINLKTLLSTVRKTHANPGPHLLLAATNRGTEYPFLRVACTALLLDGMDHSILALPPTSTRYGGLETPAVL